MTTQFTPSTADATESRVRAGGAADRELVAAARMLLARMNVDPADLMTDPEDRPAVPTFDEYIPGVEDAVSTGTSKTYGSYWNRIRAKWGSRSLLEPTPTEIKQFAEEIKGNAVQRRNSRGGRGTAENFIAALRCIYRHAEDDGLIKPDENPARRTAKPRRQGSVRHALSATQMSEINFYAGTTGDDPELDTLLLRLHTESACRTGGALALRPRDLNSDQCLIYLREKDLNRRLDERKGTIIAEWKSQGVYPYVGEPLTPTEEVEREIFDIVAVVASPAIGKDPQQKELSLRLLQEATRSEPTKIRRIMSKVLTLSDDEQEVMVDLLERTTFGSIIRSAQTVADRADFVTGLRRLLYADETRKVFREVDQLHPMLVNEPWIFGDEWTFALSESGLTRVVKDIVTKTEGTEFAPAPVRLPSGKHGRVDMVFYRHLPESERNRNLVVELKRPMRVTMIEYGQLNNYATAITGHPEVADTTNDWDFWLVATDMDNAVRNLCNDPNHLGLATTTPQYRLWVVTWGQLLDRADRRLDAFRQALELVSTDKTSRAYLQRKHAEFIPESEKD